jgi:hypothetical protein
MLSVKRTLAVATLCLLIGRSQAQAAAQVTPIVAPKGAKVLTVGVIGGDGSNSIIKVVTDRRNRLWLDRLGAFSR